MAYYENITAGRGAIDSFANALNSQRFANLMLNETISNFSNNITRAGALYDEARIREDALKYQRMQDFYNNKRKDEALELEKKQAELNMDFAKNREAFNELRQKEALKSDKLSNENLALTNAFKRKEQEWLMKAIPRAKAIVAANNNANNTPITPIIPKKTITKEEFQAIYANPMFRY
ncbi:hypothetical protein [Helicobacter pylori]|uniref:hypothetical protein n=1 Tax=Helicobacter pylori TaxID=210 RepID=UPI0029292A80|nr:hypothetical protein [Helicobacter pylori]MDU9702936.1 hypothetical protein [Helicobacter pylori]